MSDQHGTEDKAHPHESDVISPYQRLEVALREILIEKGVLTAEEIREMIDLLESRTPALGAKIVARAWVDPAYKERLLKDAVAAAKELDITMFDGTRLVVLENTEKVHNLVVCTLCSCYPRPVLGLPPEWYKNKWYRKRAVREPRKVLHEFGTDLGEEIQILVHDSTAELRYLVLPLRPEGTDNLSETELADLVTRDCMIGVTQVKPPKSKK